ncbi:MAG: hypothetical protein JNM34_04410 [Chthonomonadaceae bacterium]|nr:hypothetical protein [Chthonomonadaceae bacterium]
MQIRFLRLVLSLGLLSALLSIPSTSWSQKYAKTVWEGINPEPTFCYTSVTLPASGDRVWVGTKLDQVSGDNELFATRIDVNGNVLWAHRYPTPGGYDIVVTPYAGVGTVGNTLVGATALNLPLGLTQSVFYKIAPDGTLLASAAPAILGTETVSGIDVGPGGNIVYTATSTFGQSGLIAKLDTNLAPIWWYSVANSPNYSAPKILPNQDILFASNDDNTDDVRLVRLTSNGSTVYDVQIGGNATDESAIQVFGSSSGETYLLFYFDRFGPNEELRLRRVDGAGSGMWTVASPTVSYPVLSQIPSSDLVMVGQDGDELRFSRITDTGNVVWSQNVGYSGFKCYPNALTVSSDSLINCVGYIDSLANNDSASMATSLTPTGALLYKWQGPIGNDISVESAWAVSPLQGGGLLVGGAEHVNGVQVGFVRRLQAELKVVSALATIRLGRLNSGNLVSLIDDDGNQYEICKFLVPNQSTPPINVEFDSVVGADYPANNIEFKVVSSATTTGLQQNVELWNWTNGTWDSSNLQNMLLTEQSSLTAGVSGNHIQPATRQVRARVRVAVTGLVLSSNWCVRLDQATWLVRP